MPLPKEKAWFAAKSYGWGWGLLLRWQGWAVMAGFVVALIAGAPLAARGPLQYIAYALCLCAVLTGLCYWKGEKPSWRWGPRE